MYFVFVSKIKQTTRVAMRSEARESWVEWKANSLAQYHSQPSSKPYKFSDFHFMRLCFKVDVFSVARLCCFLRFPLVYLSLHFRGEKKISCVQNHVFYAAQNPFRVRNKNLTLCGSETFLMSLKTPHRPRNIPFFFWWLSFSNFSTSDKNNIMLLYFKRPKPPHPLTQTVLKHRKQLKCFLCIFMLLALDKFTLSPSRAFWTLKTQCFSTHTQALPLFSHCRVFGFQLKLHINFI